jgi:hypothetical protein
MLDKSRRSRGAENCMHVGALIRWRLSVPKVKSKKTALRHAAAGACAIVMPRNINRSLSLRDTKLVGLISWPRISISS